jgi:uncharacterized membrane protein YqjE
MSEYSSPNFLESLRTFTGSLVSMVQTRLELATVELAEEKSRLLSMALMACFGLVFFGLAMITLSVLVAIMFWDTYRWQALGILVGVYLLACVVCLLVARNMLRHAPSLFEATLAEIEKDREALRK